MLAGPAGDLLDHLGRQDVVAFTGSASTGARIRGHVAVVRNNVRVNLEADSLNAVVVGPDVEPGSELFDLVIRDALTEVTQKAGQKCTATRRMLVPTANLEAFKEVLAERLGERAGQVGNPADKANRMGPLATAQQLRDGRAGLGELASSATIVRGDPERREFNGVEPGQGYFMEPILLETTPEKALDPASAFHHTEVFGPVSTLLPYDGSAEQAATIIGHGQGSLVSTVYSNDKDFVASAVANMAPMLGRLVVANEKTAQGSLPPGGVFPQVNHGGPGRAGGGEELGGRSGMLLYLQRTTIQGGASQLARLLGK
jgi:oxepin-CoA hydrolase/3-oxo-5,6-dehydrosuberyl-CoA semialdehyde dehydrogenase